MIPLLLLRTGGDDGYHRACHAFDRYSVIKSLGVNT